MKSNILLPLLFALAVNLVGHAQEDAIKKADSKFSQYAYVDAIKTYERVAEKGYKSIDMFKKLGDAYYFKSDLPKAEKWYTELFAMTQDLDPEYYFRYSQCLKAVGQNEKADKMMAVFNEKSGNDSRAKLYKENLNYMDEIKANSGRYKIGIAEINSGYSDYGAFMYKNKLYFASTRDTGYMAKRLDKWNNQYFSSLYSSDVGKENSLGKVSRFGQKIGSKFNQSTPVFTKDGKTMYFTGNPDDAQKTGKREKERFLKIYKSTMVDGEWQKPVALPFNGAAYNVAHPALSPDEKTMYFASNMPGGMGQSDLYKVSIEPNGTFGKPENLGPEVNTEGKETFPFVNEDNEIYFSSDGRPGLGGLDIFGARIDKDGKIGKILNVGEPANSQTDDFAYFIDTKTRYGFLSSNRTGGKGSDDIYKFLETKKLFEDEYLLEGIVTDLETGEILSNAKVSLFDDHFNLLKQAETAQDGKYNFQVMPELVYYLRTERVDYHTKEDKTTIAKDSLVSHLNIQLESSTCKVTVGDNLGKCFGIKTIYFDLNKSDIKPLAAIELEKILDVMQKNPKMKIDVRAHTDSRGSAPYNQKLSDRRAKSTVDWLVKKGIAKNRLTAKGYGESKLVNNCSDGVDCTEEEHSQNRRSEFIIISIN